MTSRALDDALVRHGITHCRVLLHGDVVYTAGPRDVPLAVNSVRKSVISALFAVDRLLAQPLGFRDWDPLAHSRLRYGSDPLGATTRYPNYAMALSPRDLAAFGQLYLDGGEWQGQQIAPVECVRAMHPAAGGRGPARPFGHYGYLWWVHGEDDSSSLPAGSFSALGLGGQAHSVIPSHGLVIVAMSDNRKGGNYRMAIPDAVVNAVLELDMIVSLES